MVDQTRGSGQGVILSNIDKNYIMSWIVIFKKDGEISRQHCEMTQLRGGLKTEYMTAKEVGKHDV